MKPELEKLAHELYKVIYKIAIKYHPEKEIQQFYELNKQGKDILFAEAKYILKRELLARQDEIVESPFSYRLYFEDRLEQLEKQLEDLK